MIPPSPAINDAIGLLAAISDPEKAKALLIEARDYVVKADATLRQAQEVAVAGQIAARDQAALIDKLGQERVAFVEEKNRRASEWDTQSRGIDAAQKAVIEKQKQLGFLQDHIDAESTALRDRETAVVHDRQILDAREKDLIAREAELAETLKQLGPIAAKLGLTK